MQRMICTLALVAMLFGMAVVVFADGGDAVASCTKNAQLPICGPVLDGGD